MYEILDNAVDEAQGGFASRIDVVLLADGSVSITDNGRGVCFVCFLNFLMVDCALFVCILL